MTTWTTMRSRSTSCVRTNPPTAPGSPVTAPSLSSTDTCRSEEEGDPEGRGERTFGNVLSPFFPQSLPTDRFTTLAPFFEFRGQEKELDAAGGDSASRFVRGDARRLSGRSQLLLGLGIQSSSSSSPTSKVSVGGRDQEDGVQAIVHLPHLTPIREPIVGPKKDKKV